MSDIPTFSSSADVPSAGSTRAVRAGDGSQLTTPARTPTARSRRRALVLLLIGCLAVIGLGWRSQSVTLDVAGSIGFLIVCAFGGYLDGWSWTGIGPSSQVAARATDKSCQAPNQGKTLWDVLQLLFLPTVLAFGGVWFNDQQSNAAEQRAAVHAQNAVLSGYLSQISDLIVKDGLGPAPDNRSEPGMNPIGAIARARTLTTLPQLDSDQKSNVVRFLIDSNLIRQVNLSVINLQGVSLQGFTLDGAQLAYAWLDHGADLSFVSLRTANLTRAHLDHTTLVHANLSGASLAHANLFGADLSYADLTGADLYCDHPATINPEDKACDPASAPEPTTRLAGVTWNHTTCPDGTRSDSNPAAPQSCSGSHLRPPVLPPGHTTLTHRFPPGE